MKINSKSDLIKLYGVLYKETFEIVRFVNVDPIGVYLVGSFVNGIPHKYSDIDIHIYSNNRIKGDIRLFTGYNSRFYHIEIFDKTKLHGRYSSVNLESGELYLGDEKITKDRIAHKKTKKKTAKWECNNIKGVWGTNLIEQHEKYWSDSINHFVNKII